MNDLRLDGCSPTPVASYLKSVGLLRVISAEPDENVRGFWSNERFVLRTSLALEEVVSFLVEKYQPSPILSPWNGAAGFMEGAAGDDSTRAGAELVQAYSSAAARFSLLRNAAGIYAASAVLRDLNQVRAEAKLLQERKRKRQPLGENEKQRLKFLSTRTDALRAQVILELRSKTSDEAVEWFDVCQRITESRLPFPLLGAGGLDGRRDFGVNFGHALQELFDLSSGQPLPNAAPWFRSALCGAPVALLPKAMIGLFDPGKVGENMGVGLSATLPGNPADLVLMLEGTLFLAGAVSRRLDAHATRATFPFTVPANTAGSGATAPGDDLNAAEFWAPLWESPASRIELEALFSEGRATLEGANARSGVEFAIAAKTLGTQRGISSFQRFGVLQREPKNPKKATPLSRVAALGRDSANLVAALYSTRWLEQVREFARGKGVTPMILASLRALEDALIDLAERNDSASAQVSLACLGDLVAQLGKRANARHLTNPPPLLSSGWVRTAEDDSAEFALASALASLCITGQASLLPFRAHLVPIEEAHRTPAWQKASSTAASARVTWLGRNLCQDLIATLQRRLLESERRDQRRAGSELPTRGLRNAPLWAVVDFLNGHTHDHWIARLAAGLAWCHSSPHESANKDPEIPLAYAALKPLFSPAGIPLPDSIPTKPTRPLALLRLLASDRLPDVFSLTRRMALASGLCPAMISQATLAVPHPRRLAASLAFPLGFGHLQHLTRLAYPQLSRTDKEIYAR